MRGEHLLEKLGCVDGKWVEDANKTVKKKRPVVWSAIAAALVACLAWGCFMLSDAYLYREIRLFGSQEEVMRIRQFVLEDHLASYEILDRSPTQKKMLSLKKGELLTRTGEISIYRYAGRDDLVYLIFEREDSLELGEFYHFVYAYGEDLANSRWNETFGVEGIESVVPVTSASEVLRLIYGVEDVDDIQSVTFEKSNVDNTARGKSVKVEDVTLRDRETLSEFFDMIKSLEYRESYHWFDTPVPERVAERQAQIDALNIPTTQLMRKISVKLKSGYELKMMYNGYGGLLTFGEAGVRLDDAANDWFIEHAGIDFTYQGYAENPIVTGCETATVRSPEEQTESEEDLNTVGSPPISSSS